MLAEEPLDNRRGRVVGMIRQVEKAAFPEYPPGLVERGSLQVGKRSGEELPKDFGGVAAITETKEECS